MAKALPVTVKNRKTGKVDIRKNVDMMVNNSLAGIEYDDPEFIVKHDKEILRGGDPTMSRAFRAAAKAQVIKKNRRGKKRK